MVIYTPSPFVALCSRLRRSLTLRIWRFICLVTGHLTDKATRGLSTRGFYDVNSSIPALSNERTSRIGNVFVGPMRSLDG